MRLNGNLISFNPTGFIKLVNPINEVSAYMWMIDDEVVNEKNSIHIHVRKNIFPPISKKAGKSFCGFKLPVRFVR